MSLIKPQSVSPTMQTPTRRQDLRVREIDGDGLLYDPLRDSVHYLNATAYRVWQLCTDGLTASDIQATLSAEFDDVPPATIERDIAATLEQLWNDDLIQSEAAV